MVKKNAEKDVGFVRQFNELKKKHPDAVLLFRKGDFYEMYKEDALKASVILALKVSDKILPLEKDPIKLLTFPRHELDKHLPKLIRSGQRVAICEAIDQPKLMKKPKEKVGEELKSQDKTKKENKLMFSSFYSIFQFFKNKVLIVAKLKTTFQISNNKK